MTFFKGRDGILMQAIIIAYKKRRGDNELLAHFPPALA